MSIPSKVKELLSSGKPSKGLDLLIDALAGQETDISNDLILLSSRLNTSKRLYNMNLQTYGEVEIERNKIVHSILNYLELIQEKDLLKGLSLENLKPTNQASKKILFVASNPEGTPKFDLEKEFLEIRKIFSEKRKAFEVIELFDSTLRSLFEKVRKEKPDILHISCASNDEYMIVANEDGSLRKIPYDFLTDAFYMFQPYLECVFFNTFCSEGFLKQISIPLKRAIGCNKLVRDDHSILFSTGFYTAISNGKTINDSYEIGKRMIALELENQNPIDPKQNKNPYVIFSNGLASNADDETA